jgi:hypothetical protein
MLHVQPVLFGTVAVYTAVMWLLGTAYSSAKWQRATCINSM